MHEWNMNHYANTHTRDRSSHTKNEFQNSNSYVPTRRQFNKQISSIEVIDHKIHDLLGVVKNKHIPHNASKHTTSLYEQFKTGKFNDDWSKYQKAKPKQRTPTKYTCRNQTNYRQEGGLLTHQDYHPHLQNAKTNMRHNMVDQLYYQNKVRYLNYDKYRVSELDRMERLNSFQYMKMDQIYERKYIPERSKSPILMKPVSKYIRPQKQVKETERKNLTPLKAIKRSPYLNSISPAERLKTSREVTEFLQNYRPTQSSNEKSLQTSARGIQSVLIVNQNNIETKMRVPDVRPFDSKNIPEESPSLQESKQSQVKTNHQEQQDTPVLKIDEYQFQKQNTLVSKLEEDVFFKKNSQNSAILISDPKRQEGQESFIENNAEPTAQFNNIRASHNQSLQYDEQNAKNFEIKLYPCDLDSKTIKPFIADKFVEIIKVDMELDELRANYSNRKENSKRRELTKSLWQRGWRIDQDEAEDYIGVKNYEAPTQFKTLDIELSVLVESLVDKFLEGEYFWDKKIDKFLTQNEIDRTNFLPRTLDLEKRGFLKVEDLTCFINLYATGKSKYKNRHVKSLFERFTREETKINELPYSTFLRKICGLEKK